MSKGDIHTVKHGDGWANRAEGNERVSNTAPTKAEAQAKGREMAVERGVEHGSLWGEDGPGRHRPAWLKLATMFTSLIRVPPASLTEIVVK